MQLFFIYHNTYFYNYFTFKYFFHLNVVFRVKIPHIEGFLLFLDAYRPQCGTIPNFIEALESFYDYSEYLSSINVIIAADFIVNLINVTNSHTIYSMPPSQSIF